MHRIICPVVLSFLLLFSATQSLAQLTITCHKFQDNNRNGVQDSNENSYPGWALGLFSGPDCRSLITELSTDGNGNAVFDVNPGSYSVGERLEGDYESTTGGRCQNVDIDQDSVTVIFGNYWMGQDDWR